MQVSMSDAGVEFIHGVSGLFASCISSLENEVEVRIFADYGAIKCIRIVFSSRLDIRIVISDQIEPSYAQILKVHSNVSVNDY